MPTLLKKGGILPVTKTNRLTGNKGGIRDVHHGHRHGNLHPACRHCEGQLERWRVQRSGVVALNSNLEGIN